MELKHSRASVRSIQDALLIVPYGIETDVARFIDFDFNLLIVPYGIETSL